MKRLVSAVAIAAFALHAPSPANAHMMSTGLGPFYDGLAHLFLTPEDLLPVVALALLAGLRGAAWGRAVLLALPAAWLAGSAAGAVVALPVLPPPWAALTTVSLGALVAADAMLPLGLLTVVAVVLGFATGGESSPALMAPFSAGLFLVGGITSMFVVVSLIAGHVATVHRPAPRIAVRVAGSWIAAIGLLTFGWASR